jgi:hypothetical protein
MSDFGVRLVIEGFLDGPGSRPPSASQEWVAPAEPGLSSEGGCAPLG